MLVSLKTFFRARASTKPVRKPRQLTVEKLDERVLLSTVPAYFPLPGHDVNLEVRRIGYNENGRDLVGLTVLVTNPHRERGGFSVRLYWEDGSGRRTIATYKDKQAIKTTTPVWGPETNVGIRFSRDEVKPKPKNARALIAVVDPTNATRETSERDNAIVFDLRSGETHPDNPPATKPRTFIFLLGGWLSDYFEPSGMNSLGKAIRKSGKLETTNIYVRNGRGTGPAIINDALAFIQSKLQQNGYNPKDKVILVGHSLGGDAARRLAGDVSTSYPGEQAAAALVTIDPISFQRVQETGSIDQSRETQKPPAGVRKSNILNIVQRHSGPEGYKLAGLSSARNIVVADPKIIHTNIDDDPAVQKVIIDFLAKI